MKCYHWLHMGIRAEPNEDTPRARLVASLYNSVHTGRALLEGIKVAILLKAAPDSRLHLRPDRHGPIQLFWAAPSRGRLRAKSVRLSAPAFLRIAPDLLVESFLLAKPGLGADIERAISELGLRRQVENQILGYWFDRLDQIPDFLPTYFPTGAVLPGPGWSLAKGGVCLDLVPVDYVWYPLSQAAELVYGHSSRLVRNDGVFFVVASADSSAWPTAFESRLSGRISFEVVRNKYGKAAADRANEDYPSLELSLSTVRATRPA